VLLSLHNPHTVKTPSLYLVIVAFGALVSLISPASAAEKPNIVVILVDDMGFSDIGPYGSEIPTPHLDALAEQGARFSQFYNTGRCCPTRATLLTGLYSHQAGMGWMTTDQKQPGYTGHLNDSCVTLAEVLNGAGYLTAMTGKWHVGWKFGVTPKGRGFQRSLNLPAGGVYMGSDSAKCALHLNGEPIEPDDERLPENWYGTDLWTDYGIRFIDEAIAEEKPFFLYLAHVAPHFPLQADAESIARFRGQYMEGWDALSEKRLARQREIGLISADWQPEARPEQIAAWDSLSDEEKDRFDHIMAVYAAVMHRLDQSIGDLVAALKERDQFDNTLILFMSDNGGNAEAGPNGRTVGDPTQADSNWFCGRSWAHLQNTPFREYKHYNHEGGIATPLIASWPAQIQNTGEWITEPAHLIDIMATCVDIAGASYPKTFEGREITPMQGQSLLPLLKGSGEFAKRPLYWEHEGNAALRVGDRKLVRKGINGPWELFDLAADRTEQNDLAEEHPEEVQGMVKQWRTWAQESQVLPRPQKGKKKGAGNQAKKKEAADA